MTDSSGPVTGLPVYGDDDDDDGVTAKYLSNKPFTEVLYTPIVVDMRIEADMDQTNPHLFDDEFEFVDYAIRKVLLDADYNVWEVEVQHHYISDVTVSPFMPDMFQCNYDGLFSVGVQVDKFETDVLGLREEIRVCLQTSMNTGKFERVLHDAFKVQSKHIVHRPGEKIEKYLLRDINVYNDEFKTTTIVSQLPEIDGTNPYFHFLLKDEDTPHETITVTEHRFTHTYVALTVFALTIFCLFMSYGCFMSRACRRAGQSKANNNDSTNDVEIVLHGKGDETSDREQLELEEVIDEIVDVDLKDSNSSPNYHQTETISF